MGIADKYKDQYNTHQGAPAFSYAPETVLVNDNTQVSAGGNGGSNAAINEAETNGNGGNGGNGGESGGIDLSNDDTGVGGGAEGGDGEGGDTAALLAALGLGNAGVGGLAVGGFGAGLAGNANSGDTGDADGGSAGDAGDIDQSATTGDAGDGGNAGDNTNLNVQSVEHNLDFGPGAFGINEDSFNEDNDGFDFKGADIEESNLVFGSGNDVGNTRVEQTEITRITDSFNTDNSVRLDLENVGNDYSTEIDDAFNGNTIGDGNVGDDDNSIDGDNNVGGDDNDGLDLDLLSDLDVDVDIDDILPVNISGLI